jgi:hypothetical protein
MTMYRNTLTGHVDSYEFWRDVYAEAYPDTLRDRQTLLSTRAQLMIDEHLDLGILEEVDSDSI